MTSLEEKIIELRQRITSEYNGDPDLYDSEDMRRIQESDYYLVRFLNFVNGDEEKAAEQMKETFHWRKMMDLNSFHKSDYPQDYYESAAIFPYLPDKEGLSVIHMRPKIITKVKKDCPENFEKYCMQLFNYIDSRVMKEFGWGLIVNCSDISVADVDFDFIFQIEACLRKHFPNGCKYCIIYGLHWSLNYLCKIVMAAMPAYSAQKIRFYRKESELLQLISRENLPDYLMGSAKVQYNLFPSDDHLILTPSVIDACI